MMTDGPNLIPLEQAMLADAELTLVQRPQNGVLDRIVAADLRSLGWSEDKITAFFGFVVSSDTHIPVAQPD